MTTTDKSPTFPTTITIDGPGSSGKSTVGYQLAQHLNYLYFDTGCLYRAVTAVALERGLAVEDESSVTALTKTLSIDVQPSRVTDGRQYSVLVDGKDITWTLRSSEVDANVSTVAAYQEVRKVLTEQMRTIGRRGQVVMVGRDIGTVVLPEAPLKIYLDATPEERARRRHEENRLRGVASNYEDVLTSLKKRDQTDKERDTAPLRAALDAYVIDTTGMSVERVLRAILNLLPLTDDA